MSDFIANEENREEEHRGFNLAALWKIVVLHWYWIVLSTIVALGAAFSYLKYTRPVYASNMKILVKDEDSRSRMYRGGQLALESMGVISNSNGFDNELEILTSSNISQRVIKSLKLYVSYELDGRLRNHELYKNNPYIVDMPENQLVDLHSLIQLKIDRQGDGVHVAGEIYVPRSKEPILFERSVKELPGSFNTPVGTITLQRNPGVGAELPKQTMYATIMPLEYAAKAYGSRLSVSASSKTTTVAVLNYLDTQPERAIDYLNELFRSYNEDANEDKNEVALKTEEFLKNRISAIREELDATESNLESYKKKNELINLTNDASNALNKLTEYQKEQVELETQLNLVTALLDYVDDPRNAFNVVPSNLGLKDADMSNLLNKYNDYVLQRNRLLKSSSPENPYVKRLTAQLEEMWPTIRLSLKSVRENILTQKRSAEDQYNLFSRRVGEAPTQERSLNNIIRQQEIKVELYLMLLQKREENYISLNSTAAKARVIDDPRSTGQVSPKTKVILLGALVLGLCFPVGLIYLLGLLRYRIEGREDVEMLTKIPVLADIPLAPKSLDGELSLAVRENSNDMMEEAFRGLRTNLRFVLSEKENVIACTSCIPGEGKTFISTNLAMSLALLGKRVIIVGLDIRKPRLVKLFGLSSDHRGITTFLSSDSGDFQDLDKQIHHAVLNPNLDVLPAGVIPPNPGELISREQLDHAIALLREHYDYVIVDTPPVGLVSDTLSAARVADMTIMVCRADYSPRNNFQLINALHHDNKMPKITLVLNGIDLKKRKYGYYYGYGKYSKYGKYGHYGHYGHYGVYGHYGSHSSHDGGHMEK
ncbi:MAG: polysaccharide biosynthesis tyrosine autokinase [Bacteroidaceae bacterium]|nr:polysaccharide biosynthesis tyrosine autokinase [Paraprevotella sp.]MDY3098216.1 polysaccharide biosynthesis tyrosine autokinase [Bacteroidaceae bacterium]MCI6743942.1 polysaccharide biosynthesis tyrosine autokinase [Paraprevotella sp.]MDD7098467.1 polysaccharide biosynthesis tyrosine autokinase [Paraprevotella sp.]MDY3288585.1 polysaccharide biosynthesis tyrosine autokinase [Bacteroidaceae bacterium]